MLLNATGTIALTASFDGPAGVGKTTLAKVMCHDREVRRHFSDGVQWLAFGRERTGEEVLAMLAGSLGVPSSDPLSSAISERLDGRRVLLVLDDVWSAEQVGAFVGLDAGVDGLLATLLTTRNSQLAASHGECLRLERLSDKASLRMLCSFIGAGSRPDGDDSAVLLRACRGNAAMLRSVGGLCRKRGIKGAVSHLEEAARR